MAPRGRRGNAPPSYGSANNGGGLSSNLIVMIAVSLASFFAGSLFSLQAAIGNQAISESCPSAADIESIVASRVKEALQSSGAASIGLKGSAAVASSASTTDTRFPSTVKKYATGMSRMTKASFSTEFDMGVPLDQVKEGEEDVLLLYSNVKAHPKKHANEVSQLNKPVPLLTVDDAIENCDELHIVLTDQTNRKQCIALVPQFESFHIQKWMRVDGHGGKVDHTESLKYVSRGYQSNGREKFRPPEPKHTRKFWDMLGPYIESMDEVLGNLKPLLEKVANEKNQLIVMVCNMGQSELLMNFVCSLKARGLDYSQVLVFATDLETKALAESMGLTAFFDEINFGAMPSEAAKGYGDRRFVAMMLAKVFCVQMVSALGYDFLFQDVDIVWYKHPLEYFDKNPGFDIYFQDDGAHSTRYAPYSANSGFYYVRHNDRTQFFLTSVLMAGDLVIKTDSHQQALIALLAEHASLYGLRVKVLSRDLEEFPGGYQFHQKSGKYMHAFLKGDLHPYIFHMSWTLNKDNKMLYFRQMGEWYLDDQCIQKKVAEIAPGSDSSTTIDLQPTCCHAEPLISCHYRDKPSIAPCHDSPPIDKGKPSWWVANGR